MAVVVISATRGEGKTSFLREHVARAAECGRAVGGIAAPAVFEDGRHVGYDLLDLRRGSRRLLVRAVADHAVARSVDAYRFDDDAVAEGNAAITTAVRDGLDTIAIDEIGPLEFRGDGWAPALEFALRECGPDQELIVVVRSLLLPGLSERFPSPKWAAVNRISPPWPSYP